MAGRGSARQGAARLGAAWRGRDFKVTTSNQQLLDALLRHQIGLSQYGNHVQGKIDRLLKETQEDLRDKIQSRLRGGYDTPAHAARVERIISGIRRTRIRSWREINEIWLQEMIDLAQTEAEHVAGLVRTVSPVQLDLVLPAATQLKALVTSAPFQGRILRDWAQGLARADIQRIESQIRIGVVEGEGNDQIARRVSGRVRDGAGGVTEITRRQATAITRTAVNHISNEARAAFYQANPGLFTHEQYVAVLDERTTFICQSLDGTRHEVGRGPHPPQHMQCRSIRVPVFSEDFIGVRPEKPVTRRQTLREFADQEGLERVPTTRAELPRGTRGRYDRFARERVNELTGQTPARVNYQEWLERQSAAFQDDVLGKARGALFRRGKLSLKKFVNQRGETRTLRDLARTEAAAFRAAGLDPEDYL